MADPDPAMALLGEASQAITQSDPQLTQTMTSTSTAQPDGFQVEGIYYSKLNSILRLPTELRLAIWQFLFLSTRFTHGTYRDETGRRVFVQPRPYGLAILRTCKTIYEEIGDTWIQWVTFKFCDFEVMIRILKGLSQSTREKIRYLCISDNVRLDSQGFWSNLPGIPMLLASMNLDRLTILSGTLTPGQQYAELNAITTFAVQQPVQLQMLCRELRHIARDSRLAHGWKEIQDEAQVIRDRLKNTDKELIMTLYRAVETGTKMAVFDEKARVESKLMDSIPKGLSAADLALCREMDAEFTHPHWIYSVEPAIFPEEPVWDCYKHCKDTMVVIQRVDSNTTNTDKRTTPSIAPNVMARGMGNLSRLVDTTEPGDVVKEDDYLHVDDYQWGWGRSLA